MRFLMAGVVIASVAPMLPPQAANAQPADHQAVFVLLRSSDPAEVNAGLAELRSLLRVDFDQPPAARPPFQPMQHRDLIRAMRFDWLPHLMHNKKFDVAADVSLAGMLAAGDLTVQTHFARMRQAALGQGGKPDEALSAAKSFYNICGLKMTAEAVDIVARAFERAHPDDPGIGQRFRLEQLDGADPTFKPEGGAMLSKIKVDPVPFEPAINAVAGKGFPARLRRGNLLLLADRAEEAILEFETALEIAELGTNMTPQQQDAAVLQATEAVGRAIRARDGLVGQSNEFLRKHIGEIPTPTLAE